MIPSNWWLLQLQTPTSAWQSRCCKWQLKMRPRSDTRASCRSLGGKGSSMWCTVVSMIVCLSVICEGTNKTEKKQIYLAGTFPISGSEGWQGGQVRLDQNIDFNNNGVHSIFKQRFCNFLEWSVKSFFYECPLRLGTRLEKLGCPINLFLPQGMDSWILVTYRENKRLSLSGHNRL